MKKLQLARRLVSSRGGGRCIRKKGVKWQVRIWNGTMCTYVGTYLYKRDALEARKQAEKYVARGLSIRRKRCTLQETRTTGIVSRGRFFRAYYYVGGKQIHIGYFSSVREGVRMRRQHLKKVKKTC